MSFVFRPLTRGDLPLLGTWLADPEVHRWWQHDSSPEAVERDFGASVAGREPGEDLVVEQNGTPVGLLQRSRVDDYPENMTDFGSIVEIPAAARTFDYLIGNAGDRHRGLGSAMLRAAVDDTFARFPETTAILVSVVAANRPSWRACENAGFRIVGSGPLVPDNPIDDPLHHVLRVDRP